MKERLLRPGFASNQGTHTFLQRSQRTFLQPSSFEKHPIRYFNHYSERTHEQPQQRYCLLYNTRHFSTVKVQNLRQSKSFYGSTGTPRANQAPYKDNRPIGETSAGRSANIPAGVRGAETIQAFSQTNKLTIQNRKLIQK